MSARSGAETKFGDCEKLKTDLSNNVAACGTEKQGLSMALQVSRLCHSQACLIFCFVQEANNAKQAAEEALQAQQNAKEAADKAAADKAAAEAAAKAKPAA